MKILIALVLIAASLLVSATELTQRAIRMTCGTRDQIYPTLVAQGLQPYTANLMQLESEGSAVILYWVDESVEYWALTLYAQGIACLVATGHGVYEVPSLIQNEQDKEIKRYI